MFRSSPSRPPASETPPSPRTSAPLRPNASPAGASPADEVFDLYLREDDEDRRSLRLSLVVAAMVHLVLLGVTLPALSEAEVEPAEEKKVIRIAPTPRFVKKPPPPPDEPPPQRVREVPMPDETPDEEEIPPPRLEEPPVEPRHDDPLSLDIPEAPPEPEPEGPVRLGQVDAPQRVHWVEPEYTEPARRVRVQGTVFLQATIDERGRVVDLEVLRGLPMGLTESAVRAVSQWRYEPSALNGKPVAVLMTVTVHFELN